MASTRTNSIASRKISLDLVIAFDVPSFSRGDAPELELAARDFAASVTRSRVARFFESGEVTAATGKVLKDWTNPLAQAVRRPFMPASVPVHIKIEGSVKPSQVEVPDRIPKRDAARARIDAAEMFFNDSCELALATLVLATCIARPGRFETSNGATDARLRDTVSGTASHVDPKCRELAEQYKWPPIADLPIGPVFDWLTSISGATEGFGRGPVGRALAAMTHVISPGDASAEMVWPLVGLEALYGRTTDGLQRQILEKSEIFLGPRTEFQKQFKNIYETRSQFIHGKMDLPFAYCPYDAAEEFERFENASYDTTMLAFAILIASLQKLSVEQRNELEFSYTLNRNSTVRST
jgi:hypothetical protein